MLVTPFGISIEVSALHSKNVLFLMLVILFGILMEVIAVQLQNA